MAEAHDIVRKDLDPTALGLHEKVVSASRRFNQRVAIDLAKIEIAKKQAKMMERYAAQAKELGIQLGSQVYAKMEKKEPSNKLRKPYEGPFQYLRLWSGATSD